MSAAAQPTDYLAEPGRAQSTGCPHCPTPRFQLPQRQAEILRGLANGYTWRQIADQLGIGLSTARTHGAYLFMRLDAVTAAQAVAVRYELGLLQAGDMAVQR